MTGCPHLMGLPISAWLLVVGGTQIHPTWWHREQRRLEEEKEDPLVYSSSSSDIKELFFHTYKGESAPLSWWKILLNSKVLWMSLGLARPLRTFLKHLLPHECILWVGSVPVWWAIFRSIHLWIIALENMVPSFLHSADWQNLHHSCKLPMSTISLKGQLTNVS